MSYLCKRVCISWVRRHFSHAVGLVSQPRSYPADTARLPTPHLWARPVAAEPGETRTSAGPSPAPGRSPPVPPRDGYDQKRRSALLRRLSTRDGDQKQSPGASCSHHRYRCGARTTRPTSRRSCGPPGSWCPILGARRERQPGRLRRVGWPRLTCGWTGNMAVFAQVGAKRDEDLGIVKSQ
jgi:hypothetical protein